MTSPRREAAFHEAGHAVVAVYQGNYIRERGVSIDEKGLGGIHIGMRSPTLGSAGWPHGPHAMTRTLLLDLAESQAGWLANFISQTHFLMGPATSTGLLASHATSVPSLLPTKRTTSSSFGNGPGRWNSPGGSLAYTPCHPKTSFPRRFGVPDCAGSFLRSVRPHPAPLTETPRQRLPQSRSATDR